ncbi:Hsp20/alpha crystallin family protein [Candidatus Tisiphia endosymbiont of Parasteatoda lunata]|uniref:Hsp20/alpha crystallin family protein n=1 Tax=Candidatus Tisiphia endosymbiont of Parasteatoda lunata TaxID=3066275 RepID=UPI00313D28FD
MLNKVKLYSLTIASIILSINSSLANPNRRDEIELDNRTLYIHSPSNIIDRHFASFDRYWQNLLNGSMYLYEGGATSTKIITEDKRYVVIMEVAGYDKSQIKINLKGNHLVVHSDNEANTSKKDSDKDYTHKDRRFNYTIRLNDDIDKKTISSNLKNGILTIILPRIEIKEADMKEIPIN